MYPATTLVTVPDGRCRLTRRSRWRSMQATHRTRRDRSRYSLCRSLLRAALVDRFRVVMFPVITGATGAERIYDGYPDVALEMIDSRTFDDRIQLVEYRPRVLEHAPLATTA